MSTIRMGRVARSIPMARPPADADEPCYWCGEPYSRHSQRETEQVNQSTSAPQVPCRGLSVYYLRHAEGIAREPSGTLDEKWKGENKP